MEKQAAEQLAQEIIHDLSSAAADSEKNSLRFRLQNCMRLYPAHRDKFGDPLFRKELMRLLLSEGQFSEARSLIPAEDGFAAGWLTSSLPEP